MKKALQIFKRDVLRLVRNPVALVITIGVCIIPSLYAWYNIVANWDPYGNTGNVRVAIANEDEGTSNDYVGELNAGDEVVSKLKDNDKLGWVFTDADAAREGVESGEYYAAVVIPHDFSRNLTSMLTGTFEQPQLEYYVNEKKNAIAPKVTDTGAQTIEEQVNATFVSTVSKTLVEKVQAAGVELDEQGAAASGGLMRGLDDANGALGDVRGSLVGMKDTIGETKRALASADDALEGLSGQIPTLTDALDKGDKLLGATRGSLRTFNGTLNDVLTRGMGQIGSASSKASAAIGEATGAIVAAGGKVDGALADVQMVINDLQQILSDIKDITGAGDTSAIIGALEGQLADLQAVKNALQAQSTDIQNTASATGKAASSLNDAAQTGISAVAGAQQSFSTDVMPALSDGLDAFSSVSADLVGVVSGTKPAVEQARGILGQLSSTLDQALGAINQTDAALGTVQDGLAAVRNDVAAARSSSALGEGLGVLEVDPDDMADFMSSPVTLTTKAVYPVANYGSGVAPFYTNLALWVGGFVLIAIIKLEVDGEGLGSFTTTQAYFGRWLLLVALGLVQALVVCAGDLVIGVQCEQPVLFMLAGLAISFVYVSLIYALAIAFKHIGKAIAVILVIVQIPGSSGMYPIEMMPDFFQRLHPLLPFTYGINAMRETIGGMYGMDYLANLGYLALFLVAAYLIGVVLRPVLLNLNLLFDRQLEGTGVMICEKDDRPRERFSLRTAMRALLDASSYKRDLIVRAERFERRYPKLIKAGFVLVFGLPVVLFVLTATLDLDIDGKIGMLALWIASIIAADAYMIVVEYIRESMRLQLRVAAMSDEGIRREIRQHVSVAPLVARMTGVNLPDDGIPEPADGESGPDALATRKADPAETDQASAKGGDAL